MKKLILIFTAMALASSFCFAAKKRVFIDGKPKMLEVNGVYEYDKFGNLINDGTNVFNFNEKGQPLEIVESGPEYGEQKFELQYDEAGRITVKRNKFTNYTMYYYYDNAGNLTYEGNHKEKRWADFYTLYENGKKTFTKLNTFNSVKYTYDNRGNLVKADYTDTYSDLTYQDTYEYNAKNQLVKKNIQFISYDPQAWDPPVYDEAGQEVKYEYDDNGNCIYIEDLTNGSILREYDEKNHMIYEYKDHDDELGDEAERYFEYDEKGNLITVKNTKYKDSEDYANILDSEGRILERTYVYGYNSQGKLINYEDHKYEYPFEHGYYEPGEMRILEDNIDLHKQWDDKGRLIYHESARGVAWGYVDYEKVRWVKYQYDDSDRVIKKVLSQERTMDQGDTYIYMYEPTEQGGYKQYEFIL